MQIIDNKIKKQLVQSRSLASLLNQSKQGAAHRRIIPLLVGIYTTQCGGGIMASQTWDFYVEKWREATSVMPSRKELRRLGFKRVWVETRTSLKLLVVKYPMIVFDVAKARQEYDNANGYATILPVFVAPECATNIIDDQWIFL